MDSVCYTYNDKEVKGYRGLMFLLAAMPILNIYKSPFVLAWGDVLFAVFLIFEMFNARKNRMFFWTKGYVIYWIYVAISFAFASFASGNLHRVILPGGVAFFVFSLQLGFFTPRFNISNLYKGFKLITTIAIAIFALQELSALVLGHRFSVLLPFGVLTDGHPMHELISTQIYADRSCSIFREPAHFAQYLQIMLILELFYKNSWKMLSPFLIMIIITLLLLRSGNGLITLLVLMIIKYFDYVRQRLTIKHVIVLLLLTGGVVAGLHYYIDSTSGTEVMARTSEFERDESSKSYIRIYRGFDLYNEMPTFNKIFGTDVDGITRFARQSSIAYLFMGEEESDTYFNGVQNVLIRTGVLGLIFLLVFFIIPVYKKDGILGRASLWSLLAVSLVGQLYLSQTMLLVYLIAIKDRKTLKS